MPSKPVDLTNFEDSLRCAPSAMSTAHRERMLDRYSTTYYLYPDPDSAWLWLQCAASIHRGRNVSAQNLLLFFFARLAQLSPGVETDYLDLANATADEPERAFVLTASHLAVGNVKSLPYAPDKNFPYSLDVLATPVRYASDLDYLWMEFFLTGNEATIRAIIAVLAWPDRTKVSLKNSFTSLGKGLFPFRRRFIAARLQRLLGIDFNRKTGEALVDIDLDVRCGLDVDYQARKREDFAKIRAALPFHLSKADQDHLLIKSAACWSLVSNLHRHQRIRNIYDSAVDDLEQRSRLRLDVSTPTSEAVQDPSGVDRSTPSKSGPGTYTALDWPNYKGPKPMTLEFVLNTQAIAAGLAIVSMHLSGVADWVTMLAMQYKMLAWMALPGLIAMGYVAATLIQLWAYLLLRAGWFPAIDKNGKHAIFYICDVPPYARSKFFYSISWPLIMSIFALAAGLGGSLIAHHLHVGEYSHWFWIMFIGQWFVSFALVVCLARNAGK